MKLKQNYRDQFGPKIAHRCSCHTCLLLYWPGWFALEESMVAANVLGWHVGTLCSETQEGHGNHCSPYNPGNYEDVLGCLQSWNYTSNVWLWRKELINLCNWSVFNFSNNESALLFHGHILGPLEKVSAKHEKAHFNVFLEDNCPWFRFKSRKEGWESFPEQSQSSRWKREGKKNLPPPFFPCSGFIPHSEKRDLIVAYCGLIQLIKFLLPCNKVGWNLRDFFCNNSLDPIPGQHHAAHFY